MSNVSRSVYQKLMEENKRLLNDIFILTMNNLTADCLLVKDRWRKKFKEEAEFNDMVREMCRQYMKDNPNDPAVKFVKSLKP